MKNIAVLPLIFASLILCGCGNNPEPQASLKPVESTLRGAFVSSESIHTKIKKEMADGQYLYLWKYPQFLLNAETEVLYRVDQRLTLKRDFTYNWNYTIILGNPGEWGNLEIAKIAVDISGTFSFHQTTFENQYSVNLSNPTFGTEEIYGCNINNMTWFGGWTMHAEPDMVNDFETLSKTGFTAYSKYVCARSVLVRIDAEGNRVLYSDLFFRDCLEDIAHYSTY